MRENYFKSFFKSFGFFPVILAILGVVAVGYLSIFNKVGNTTLCSIVTACILFTSCGFTLLGFSGLKREQISLNDFTRCVFMISSIVLGVFELNTGTKFGLVYGIAFFAMAAILLIQIIIRLVKCISGDPNRSYKNYFGALAGSYNPLFILILGLAISVAVVILGKYIDVFNTKLVNISNYKYLVFGVSGAIVLLTLITSSVDKDTEATFIDFILAVLFVATTSLSLFLVSTDEFGASFPRYVVVVAAMIMVCILVRALTYTKEKSYVNSMHKVRTYFKSTYDKYDAVLPFLFALCALVLLAVAFAAQNPNSPYYIINALFKKNGVMSSTMVLVLTSISAGLLVLGVILSFIYHKFTSQDIVRVDKVLIFLMFTSSIIVVFEVLSWLIFGKFALTTLIALGAAGAVLLYTIIIQIVRLRNYNPIAAFATTQPYQYESKQEEPQQEEQQSQEEEPQQEEEEEATDPFGLTAEDEAIYESIYGKDEAEEKPQEEEVVYEEVAEEEPQEDVVYEEVPAEEAEVTEEADEDVEADEAEEEDEVEDEAEELDEADSQDEVAEPEEEKKESNIVIQEFQVVDENGEPKKIKRKFNTKMMFAPYETKEYYNEIKNYLTMYRAKGRVSSSCETFRYKGLVAKVALGGKSVKVFLALDTSIIDENPKYHLKDFSEKKRYQEVPVMIKVRSPRSLKYFKELVDIMMANRGVKPKRNFEPTDYMPQLIPNGEAILASLGMSTYYLQNTMNVKGIPEEMPDDLEDYIPMIAGDPLDDEEIEANVYLDTLCQHFEDGAEVTIDILKSLHIVTRGNVIHIKARGTLDRKLIIYAEKFDSDALKMLMCTNGTAIKIVR